MQRRRARLERTTTAIDELLRGQDYPEAVRRAVALALKGGRWSKQLCLKCRKRARQLSTPTASVEQPVPAISVQLTPGGAGCSTSLRYLTLMERERGYQQLDDAFGHPFPTMRAFCVGLQPQVSVNLR